jgi:hypothetical protein
MSRFKDMFHDVNHLGRLTAQGDSHTTTGGHATAKDGPWTVLRPFEEASRRTSSFECCTHVGQFVLHGNRLGNPGQLTGIFQRINKCTQIANTGHR